MEIICELATNWAGDRSLLVEMIREAAAAGADVVKCQAYQVKHLNPADPQYDWFKACELSERDYRLITETAQIEHVRALFTAYHVEDLEQLKTWGATSVKIGSGEGVQLARFAEHRGFAEVYVSCPWGDMLDEACFDDYGARFVVLSAIPLYPAPIEAYGRIEARAGYSDHHVGIDVAKIAMAQGAQYLEKHFELEGRGRNQPWNMRPDDLRELRRWADVVTQATTGTRFAGRWEYR